MVKDKLVDIEAHAFFRMMERGTRFGLDYYETKHRTFENVKKGILAKRKHLSKKHVTYNQYFKDNLSFYVVCKENERRVLIKTVIIETGRE